MALNFIKHQNRQQVVKVIDFYSQRTSCTFASKIIDLNKLTGAWAAVLRV